MVRFGIASRVGGVAATFTLRCSIGGNQRLGLDFGEVQTDYSSLLSFMGSRSSG